MIFREMEITILELSKQFPVIALMGPRQSGKTTLSKKAFPSYAYVSLEDLDMQSLAREDPRGFLSSFSRKEGVIIDEMQRVPELFSYMQALVDQEYRPGFFIITGSQNFLLYEKITQTLAGRVALLTLLPMSVSELTHASLLPATLDELLIKGLYPRPYVQPITHHHWFTNYISTYVEKDVRQVLQVSDAITFQRFVKVCAARVGSIVNYADIARDCDISLNTAKSWISILESSYIIKLLYPYHRNFNKRVIKSPKLYFYDTGIICALLGIKTEEELSIHPVRGHIFESFILSEIYKQYFHQGQTPSLFFWRDVQGHEVDCIIEKNFQKMIPIEIKSRMTVSGDFFHGLKDWKRITEQSDSDAFVIYAGKEEMSSSAGSVVPWLHLPALIRRICGF
ncbi:MAG: ATP-binding protein [Chlamydiae bacterium]|nr:ATP-binding protein [Chlamydiota bacterium]